MIRLFEEKDRKSVIKVGKYIKSNFDLVVGDNENVMVYEKDGIIVSFIHFLKMYETIDIINLATLPEYRNLGYAGELLDELEKQDEVNHLMLEVRKNNIVAVNFYSNRGFKVIRAINNYYGDDDALIMERKLI